MCEKVRIFGGSKSAKATENKTFLDVSRFEYKTLICIYFLYTVKQEFDSITLFATDATQKSLENVMSKLAKRF